MKLGGKSRDVDSFVDQLKEEGENVVSGPLAAPGTKLAQITPQIINTELYVILTTCRNFKITREKITQMHFHQKGSLEARRAT